MLLTRFAQVKDISSAMKTLKYLSGSCGPDVENGFATITANNLKIIALWLRPVPRSSAIVSLEEHTA